MAEQEITFKRGGLVTGDSGERGDTTAADGGVESVKPIDDGERVAASVQNRAVENLRQRSERLRDAGEQQLYLQDSDMRWAITGGDASGESPGPEPYPGVLTWDIVTGKFTVDNPMVVQPLNTPAGDKQETVEYPFNDTITAGSVLFTPLTSKRDYNGANLIEIKWLEATAIELVGAAVPGICDAVVSGDPKHILTITILDTGTTQIGSLVIALGLIGVDLTTMGLQFSTTGVTATKMTLAEVQATSYGDDYEMTKNFEREVHYIPPASFATFFLTYSLIDGDTLAIKFTDYVNDAGPPPTGRRQRVPSSLGLDPLITTVKHTDLFITSAYPEHIPLSIPLCKRVGDDLFWIDGTVVLGSQTSLPVLFGEHGNTIKRQGANMDALAKQTAASGATLIGASATAGGDPDDLSQGTLLAQLAELLGFANKSIKTKSPIIPAPTTWTLLWRSEDLADIAVKQSTTSIYFMDPYLLIASGVYVVLPANILVVGDTPTANVGIVVYGGGDIIQATKLGAMVGDVLSWDIPANWTTYTKQDDEGLKLNQTTLLGDITAGPNGNWGDLFESKITGARMHVSYEDDELWISRNCHYNDPADVSKWTADTVGSHAYAWRFSGAGIIFCMKDTAGGIGTPWDKTGVGTTGWTRSYGLTAEGMGTNRFESKSEWGMAKGHAKITCEAGGTGVTKDYSYGILGGALSVTSTTIKIMFTAGATLNVSYIVQLTLDQLTSTPNTVQAEFKTLDTAFLEIDLRDMATGALIDPTLTTSRYIIHVTVFGTLA